MHGTRPLTRLVLVLALGLSVAAGAESQPEAAPGPAAKPGGIEPAAAAAAQASPQAPAEPDPAQIDAWLAAARALKAERPELFGGAEGVLAYLVLPDGQGVAAGIEPGDVLVAYGETPLGTKDQLIDLTGKTPPEQTLALRWLRPGVADQGARTAQVHGGRIGVAILDLAETPESRMEDLGAAGWAANKRGRYGEAIDIFRQGLAIAESEGSDFSRGRFLRAIGVVLTNRGQNLEAQEYHARALAIALATRDLWLEAAAHTSLGVAYMGLGRLQEALRQNEQALMIFQEINEHRGVADSLSNLGIVTLALGQYPEALKCFGEALAVRRGIRDREGEAEALSNLGNLYADIGRYTEALAAYTESLTIRRETNDIQGEAADLGNLGTVYQNTERYADAIRFHRLALQIQHEIADRLGEANAHSNLGIDHGHLGHDAEAFQHYFEALSIYREISDHVGESRTFLNIGWFQQTRGHHSEALEWYQHAFALQTQLNEPETLWRLWDNLRRLWEKEAHFASAILAGKSAVNTIQAMRAIQAVPTGNTRLTREQQQSFLADKEYVYRGLADLLIAQGRHAEAQQVLDMLKEQELYDYIKEEGAHDPRKTRIGYNAMETEWNEAYDALAAGVPPLAQRLAELTHIKPEVRTDAEQAEIARLTAERDKRDAELQRQLAALPERLAAVEPARQAAENARFAKAPDAKPAVLAALSQRSVSRTGLLQFILLPNKVRILLTTPDGWETDVVEVPAKTLATEIEALRSALTDPTQDAEPPAKALYGRLVAPLAQKIDAAKLESLLVHLDGRLRYVPFAALHDGKRWLAERWPIVYYTAASERRPELAAQEWRVAGLGVSEARKGFEPLPTVVAEIDGIVREAADDEGVLPGRVLLNADFSESALRQQAANADNRILHVASHFSLRPGNDADSSLLLGTVATDGAPDRLSLRALREAEPRLDLRHLDLVTLSACETAMGGADASGAEIEGMGAIIQRQGAHGVLASLWPVADRSTGTLMQTFYRLRAERPELTKAQALQQAQLGLLHGTHDRPAAGRKAGVAPGADCAVARRPVSLSDKGSKPYQPPADPACRWSHPYYWAPFVLMGNWL